MTEAKKFLQKMAQLKKDREWIKKENERSFKLWRKKHPEYQPGKLLNELRERFAP